MEQEEMQRAHAKRLEQFREDVKSVFSSDAGKRVLNTLKDDFVRRSSVTQSSEHTHYRLGQKEMVQLLIDAIEHEKTIPNQVINSTEE